MSSPQIPPWLREQLTRFDQLQQTLQSIQIQKQQIEVENFELEKALKELEKTSEKDPVYKSTGTIMIRSNKENLTKELNENQELNKTKKNLLEKQETRTKDNLKELQEKIDHSLKANNIDNTNPTI